jgi:hypothetical protein
VAQWAHRPSSDLIVAIENASALSGILRKVVPFGGNSEPSVFVASGLSLQSGAATFLGLEFKALSV